MTLVSDDGGQLINNSRLHPVHLKIWWNIAEKWATCGKNHLMCYPRLSSDARVTSLKSNPSIKSILSTPFKADNLTLKYIILPKQHMYCTCFWVRTWLRLKQYLMEPLNDQDTYMELVDREVTGKQKEMLVDSVWGVLRAKWKHIFSRFVPDIHLPHDWL